MSKRMCRNSQALLPKAIRLLGKPHQRLPGACTEVLVHLAVAWGASVLMPGTPGTTDPKSLRN